MAKIIDPDQLNFATEIVVDSTGPKTIQLVATGNLSNASPGATSGVTDPTSRSSSLVVASAGSQALIHSISFGVYALIGNEWRR